MRVTRLFHPRPVARAALFLAAIAPPALAGDLDLQVLSSGQATVSVTPGAAVPWSVLGELSDGDNQGLAMYTFDLAFDGGPLAPADAPVAQPLLNFSPPLGVSNPAGFGGTPLAGGLVQVGGAQNTIRNVFAPLPTGDVVTGMAEHGSPQVLAGGTLTAPLQVGLYTLSISKVMANAIRLGTTGTPFWEVDACGVGEVSSLQVIVVGLTADVPVLTVQQIGSQRLALDAGVSRAGRLYWLLGTIGGTSPGLALANGQHLPLNPSFYLDVTVANPNSPPLSNSLGLLDGSGKATATFTLPHVPPAAIGLVIHHAYVLLQPIDFVSNPVELTLVP